jgi:hypothetical protein
MSNNSIQIDKTVEQIMFIRVKVREYIEDLGHHYIQNYEFLTKDDLDHIAEIGTSIMCTKLEIGYPGGSFAQAVANNDLKGSFASADSVNAGAIRFYVMMMYNLQLNGLVL